MKIIPAQILPVQRQHPNVPQRGRIVTDRIMHRSFVLLVYYTNTVPVRSMRLKISFPRRNALPYKPWPNHCYIGGPWRMGKVVVPCPPIVKPGKRGLLSMTITIRMIRSPMSNDDYLPIPIMRYRTT